MALVSGAVLTLRRPAKVFVCYRLGILSLCLFAFGLCLLAFGHYVYKHLGILRSLFTSVWTFWAFSHGTALPSGAVLTLRRSAKVKAEPRVE